jgi:hypothetical protein
MTPTTPTGKLVVITPTVGVQVAVHEVDDPGTAVSFAGEQSSTRFPVAKVMFPVGAGIATVEGIVMVAVKVGAGPSTQMEFVEVASETCTDFEVTDPKTPICCGPVMPIALLVKVTASARETG